MALTGMLMAGSPGLTQENGRPLQADEATLLLAGFENGADRADYANGWDRFGGGGYSQVEGYYGQGIDVRGVRLPEDFWSVENGFLPHYTQWIFWPRGNVNFRQGTLEFWLKPAAADEKRVVTGGADLIHFYSYQPLRPRPTADYEPSGLPPHEELVRAAEKKQIEHVQPHVRLDTKTLDWRLVTLKGEILDGRVDFRKVAGWARELDPDQWVHFTLQWSPDGVAFYLDGRLVGSHSLKDDEGLALTGPTQRGLAVNGVIFDELRISDIPRYGDQFEPNWKTGHRPDTAFPGTGASPVAWKSRAPDRSLPWKTDDGAKPRIVQLGSWTLEFAEKSGFLTKISHAAGAEVSGAGASGLLLWEGVSRTSLPVPRASDFQPGPSGGLLFSQLWGDTLKVDHALQAGSQGEVIWRVKFRNDGPTTLWLEALLDLPVGSGRTEFFDMSWTHTRLPFARRRDEYIFSLPLVAASDGRNTLGVGLNPRPGASALIGEWLPAASSEPARIRQGTRVVLAPGETQDLEFVVFSAEGEFGVQDAIATYHGFYPDLYRLSPNVPIYSYLGVCQYFSYVNIPDLTRVYYSGGQWGHGPYHTKGDYLGSPCFWGRSDLATRADYQHAAGHQRLYKTIEALREQVVKRSRDAFFDSYTPRRSHDAPNLTARFIIEDIMPGVEFSDDPLSAGQYFAPKNFAVNEYRTPLGYKLMTDQANTMRLIAQYSPGFINDFCQSSSMRFTDVYARQSPGRAFSPDRGEYLVAAFGHMERYRMINGFFDSGRQQSMISDWGLISYMLSAYSAANAFESGDPFVFTTGMKIGLQVSRNLLGEKPTSVLTSYGLDNIGLQFEPGDFTPERLRDYYRYAFRRAMLAAFEAGYYADPPLLHGKHWNSEVNPILVESLVGGRKIVSGVRAESASWVVRGGEGARAIVVASNERATPADVSLQVSHRYFGGALIWAPYFGGALTQKISPTTTEFGPVRIAGHDIAAFKPVAQWEGTEADKVTTDWQGDGLEIHVQISLETTRGGTLRLLCPEVFYGIAEVLVNGNPRTVSPDGSLPLSAGTHQIRAVLANQVLAFSPAQWDQVDLIREGQPHFALLATSRPGYERGTASQLNGFLRQYDEEDGIVGNLAEAAFYENETDVPKDFTGWLLDVRPDPLARDVRVEVDVAKKRLRFLGRTPGDVRRGLMVFLRLLDRKYPHIGRHVPLDGNLRAGWKQPGWNSAYNEQEPGWKRLYERRTKTLKFFEDFADKDFLSKPILEKAFEPLYADGNKNFAGRYTLRTAPYLFEPTFPEDFVYGYHGPRAEEDVP